MRTSNELCPPASHDGVVRDESRQRSSPDSETADIGKARIVDRLPEHLRQRVEEARRAGPSLPEAAKEHLGAPQITPEHSEALSQLIALAQSAEPNEHPARLALERYLDALNTLLDAQEELREAVAEHVPDSPAD